MFHKKITLLHIFSNPFTYSCFFCKNAFGTCASALFHKPLSRLFPPIGLLLQPNHLLYIGNHYASSKKQRKDEVDELERSECLAHLCGKETGFRHRSPKAV
jgi:hypothetical protein